MKITKKDSKKLWAIPVLLLAIGISLGIIMFIRYSPVHSPKASESSAKTTEADKKSTKTVAKPSFDKTKYSNTDPTSVWVVVNKQHPLTPLDSMPSDLIASSGAIISNSVVTDFEAMTAAARSESVTLTTLSGYRSYSAQKTLYDNYVSSNGQTATDTFSARPGYSEHQTGLAIDFGSSTNSGCNFDDCYAATTEGKWLAAHANEYGFILRYTAEKQQITGFKNEPWHYRYVGRELAAEMKKQSITTLEEFFTFSGGTNY